MNKKTTGIAIGGAIVGVFGLFGIGIPIEVGTAIVTILLFVLGLWAKD